MRPSGFPWLAAAVVIASVGLVATAFQGAPLAATMPLRVIVASSSAEAERLRARAQRGEDAGSLAREASIDPSAANGGLLGPVQIATLRPELRDALRGLGPGQLTRVVEIPTGFAFLRVERSDDPAANNALVNLGAMQALLATGSVKYVLDVGGLPEAEAVFREFPKPRGWDQDPGIICQVRKDSLAGAMRPFENFFSQQMERVRATKPPFEQMQAHLGLAQLLAYQGNLTQAMPHYEAAYALAHTAVPAAELTMEETLGLAYLQQAGADNGVYREPGELCLIPTRPGVALSDPTLAEKAAQLFISYLQKNPEQLEVRWLLNLTSMLIGKYPEGVPPAQRIPAEVFASADDVGRFTDVAPQAGLNVFATAGGVIVDDFSTTGRFDVVTSNFDSCGPLHYFGNKGDGTFSEQTAAAGLSGQLGGLNIQQTDYNNDGCKDIFVLRGGWEVPQRNSLLKNNCDGTFTDVTSQVGLAQPATSTQTAAWADINNDGFLDVFIGNENSVSQLFLNRGGTRFEDISRSSGVSRLSFAKGVTAGDYDNDGFVDFYVSNYDGSNILYRNNRNNTFADTTRAAGAPGPGRGFSAWFFDYDNDGWLDLFATSYFMSADETARTYLSLPHNAATLKLYRNLGNGTFEDVTSRAGLDKVFMPMGANYGDIDNDGFLDIYLGMGTPSFASIAPHVLLRNQQGRSFVDVTTSSGTGELHKGHGIAFADLDNDGDEDIVAEIGGATPGDRHAMRVFENPGHANDWLSLKLVGVRSNRAAIGTRITVTVEDGEGVRRIHRSVTSGGSFGASPLEQHLGLGKSARIRDVEIWWPASNTRQHFSDLMKNQIVEITELAPGYKIVTRSIVRLGGAKRVQ